jgi:hypothetical protein
MTPNRDYEIPIKILESMTFNATEGQSVEAGEVGGLVHDEKLLPALTANAKAPEPLESGSEANAYGGGTQDSTTRMRTIKRGLLAGIVYFRLQELGHDPRKSDAIGLLDIREPVKLHWDTLAGALTTYFLSRDCDLERSNQVGSTFLSDVASLATAIDSLFKEPAPDTTVEVIGRLMRSEGWSVRPERYNIWREEAMKACHQIAERAARAVRYLELLRREWEFHVGNVDVFAFENEEAWVNAHRNRLIKSGYQWT